MYGAITYPLDTDWVPPVDFVLEVYGSTSPASIYAGTTWTQLKNCIVFAAGSTFGAGGSGGNASVSLNTNHLPSHSHTVSTGSSGGHYHSTTIPMAFQNVESAHGLGTEGSYSSYETYGDRTVTLSNAGSHGHTLTVGSAGGGQAFDIMNPYYAVNIWQRVG